MQDRPTARELLAIIAELLERDVLGALAGPLQHPVRVAGNLCRILEREIELGPRHEVREIELLSGVLEEKTAGRDARTLSQTLCDRLNRSHDPELEQRAWHAALQIVRSKLAITKPGHDAYDFRGEIQR